MTLYSNEDPDSFREGWDVGHGPSMQVFVSLKIERICTVDVQAKGVHVGHLWVWILPEDCSYFVRLWLRSLSLRAPRVSAGILFSRGRLNPKLLGRYCSAVRLTAVPVLFGEEPSARAP